MCGIAGIIGLEASEALLNRLLDQITHRGEKKYLYESVVLPGGAIGAHRLAIVDEMYGKQPFQDKEGQVFCIFNGEIYNHNKLRKELSAYYEFETECDTEVILNAYLHWEDDFVDYLDGQFAIAIYDKSKDTLVLIRDRMGIKGLYYAQYKSSLIFASEIKSLSSINEVNEVIELKPGTIWKNNSIKSYFNLKQFASNHLHQPDLNSYLQEAKDFLTRAVSKRISKEFNKVACLLSGGLDSSIVTYIANKLNPATVAYTIVASDAKTPDLLAAQQLCLKFGIKHVIVSPPIEEMQKFYLQEGVYMTESYEPILVRNAVTYHFLCRELVKDGFKYCLNGEGADELFGGYDFVREAPSEEQDEVIWNSLSIISRTYLQMSDRASMYATLETRVPYMDKEFVEFCLSLPPYARINKHENKVLLRKLFENELPQSIINQRKIGMNEGAGYGVNSSIQSIYYKAVLSYYQQHPQQKNEDTKICNEYSDIYKIDMADIEEIYNFAKFVSSSYTKAALNKTRLQLNGKLLQTKLVVGA